MTQEIDAAMEVKETESAWGTRSWGAVMEKGEVSHSGALDHLGSGICVPGKVRYRETTQC